MWKLCAHLKLAEGNQESTICGNGAGPSSAGCFGERMDHQWTGTLVCIEGDGRSAKCERDARTGDGYHNEGQSVRTFLWDFCQSGDLHPCTHPDWHVLSLAPAGSAVSVDEFEDWIKWTNPAMMQLRPLSGTDEHEYAQLVKLLKEKDYVSRRCSRRAVLSFFLTVLYAVSGWDIEGITHGTVHGEHYHRVIHAR